MTFRPLSFSVLTLFGLLSLLPVVPTAQAQNGTWTRITSAPTPPGPRREFGAIYDPDHERYLIFGGATDPYQLYNEVWVLSMVGTPTWSRLAISGVLPGERHSPQWGYDAARNRVLIFGGYGRRYPGQPYEYLNDVWQLSLDGTPQWTELNPAGQAPAGRLAGAAVYDPMRQRFVGFGGTAGLPVDTWVLNLRGEANWQQLPIGGARPNGGWGMTSTYDAKRDRMLIFGGSSGADYYGSKNEVWELALRGVPEWKQLTTVGPLPKARRSATAIFDPIRDRMVIYGGFDAVQGSDEFLADTWALDFSGATPTWAQLLPAGTVPTKRDAMAAAYDPIRDRMVVFGGWSGTAMLGDTQFLEWGGTSSDAVLTPAASATPTAAHVEWDVTDASGTLAAVYRRDAGGEWTSLSEAEVDASGQLTFDDTSVVPGSQYTYMMVVGSHRGETFGGEAMVQIPSSLDVNPDSRLDFAIDRISPNPAVRRMSVSFRLPTSEPARIELIDVSGRLWLARDVNASVPGTQSMTLETSGELSEGLYFVRLIQGARVATSRVTVLGAR